MLKVILVSLSIETIQIYYDQRILSIHPSREVVTAVMSVERNEKTKKYDVRYFYIP